jgi:2'-5' RNA ligase
MIRVFLAVELSSGIRENLFSLQQELKKTLPPVNWVRPESIHLTVKFLGYVEPSRISQLLLALEPIGTTQPGFSIEVQGVGVFPQIKHPRILWVGVTGKTHALQELVLEIEAALEPLGFPPEEKPYHPHLTLARIKRDNTSGKRRVSTRATFRHVYGGPIDALSK